MTPQLLDLDFRTNRRWGRWIEIALLATVMAVGTELLTVFLRTQTQVERLESRKSSSDSMKQTRAISEPLTEVTIREADRINAIIDKLTVPWDKLFRALETTPRERVALLSLTPDQRAGTALVAGEAADLGAMFSYIDRLQKQPTLASVYLLSQKFEEQDIQHPIRFTVTASWLDHDSK